MSYLRDEGKLTLKVIISEIVMPICVPLEGSLASIGYFTNPLFGDKVLKGGRRKVYPHSECSQLPKVSISSAMNFWINSVAVCGRRNGSFDNICSSNWETSLGICGTRDRGLVGTCRKWAIASSSEDSH